jgi:hypothetical protein
MALKSISLLRYNWPLYVTCIAVSATGALIHQSTENELLRLCGLCAGVVAAWYGIASFFSFWWMFDRSPLLSGTWLPSCFEHTPRTCKQLCIALDATIIPIDQIFPQASCSTYDLFDQAIHTEPAIARAKAKTSPQRYAMIQPDDFADKIPRTELTLVTLAAHEIRDEKRREQFILETIKSTEPGGKIIIVEHLRNVPAFLAFGPGLLHFYPKSLWLALFQKAQLCVEKEFRVTPFAHVFVLTLGFNESLTMRA